MESIKVKIEKEVTMQQISDILCSALEGGSNYWMEIKKKVAPRNFNNTKAGEEKFTHIAYPMNDGGYIIIEDIEADEPVQYTLNLNAIRNGLKIMAEKESRHFNDFITENDDAITADVFLQCCLLGKTIYG